MGITNHLKTIIRNELCKCSPRAYDELAPSDTQYPYILFALEKVAEDEKANYQLEINAYDYSTDAAIVEDLADLIESTLNHYFYNDNKLQFRVLINVRNTVYEDDKKIRRRRLLFDLILFERSQ